ncbi:uncharacterized protein EDB93DRAFT_1101766 [Suillus bovinus]|uniref:uncharacterized protein n=1 Tax=Suillus bovinus TaxID=48563 RepID=UPI001B8669B8|nr:uncharacterized protein EDB93DRAFT_1101766 [Suillus bovinus]KAG2155173.1 hypothetical protein EDB93DRAFT_1101766 [Suillus bovinus]
MLATMVIPSLSRMQLNGYTAWVTTCPEWFFMIGNQNIPLAVNWSLDLGRQCLSTEHLVCVRVEHAFAALKGQFQSLKDLQQNINSADDLRAAVHWIQYCLILHNMIIQFEEQRGLKEDKGTMDWAHEEGNNIPIGEGEGPDGNEQIGDRLYEGTPGHALCERLIDELFDSSHSRAQRRQG